MVNLTLIDKNHKRLQQIKDILDKESNHTIDSIYKRVKGNSLLYTIINRNKIIIPTPDGIIWNNKIPVSVKLARTISEQLRVKSDETKARYLIKKNKGNASTISTTITKSKTTKKKPNNVTTTKKVSLFWGMISWDR